MVYVNRFRSCDLVTRYQSLSKVKLSSRYLAVASKLGGSWRVGGPNSYSYPIGTSMAHLPAVLSTPNISAFYIYMYIIITAPKSLPYMDVGQRDG